MSAESPQTASVAESVRSLELFFDLVFVFMITQIASLLTARPDGVGLLRVAAVLAVTWWMYAGYAWLTNALDLERTGPRLLLLLGMAAFFVMSLAVPRAFEAGPWGLVLGLAYLVVVLVHTFGFVGTSGQKGIARLGPINLLSAVVVVVAGAVPEQARLWMLGLACAIEWVTPLFGVAGGFTVGVGHFVERHGLAVLILLGESIAEVGSAAAEQSRVLTVLVGALLALVLSTAMWWLYFDREERDSERLLLRVPVADRSRVAVHSFGYSYYVMIFGIAVASVGMQRAVDSFAEPLHGLPQGLLPLGAALFLAGLACFRRSLGGPWPVVRAAGAAAVVAGVPAGRVGGWLVLVVTTVVLVGVVLIEKRAAPDRPASAR